LCTVCLISSDEQLLAENEVEVTMLHDMETIGYMNESSGRMLAALRYQTGYVSYNKIDQRNNNKADFD